MATRAVRERLARDLGPWLADGLISEETHALLRKRYEARTFGIGEAIKYLGIAGGLFAFFGLLGLAAALADSTGVAGFFLLIVGAGLAAGGLRLSRDELGRYGTSSKVLFMLGIVTASLGIDLVVLAFDVRSVTAVVITGAIALPAVGFLAYRFGNIFVLVLGLLGFFHWVGSFTAMLGRSTYEVDIQDPRLMSGAALLVVAVGLFHELRLRKRTRRFYQAYEATGLVYLNLSLLILSIDANGGPGGETVWIFLLALAALAQIGLGARLGNGLFTGFGVTAFAINVYTRYFEEFWKRTHEGVFFLLGGVSLFAAGAASEVLLKRRRGRSA